MKEIFELKEAILKLIHSENIIQEPRRILIKIAKLVCENWEIEKERLAKLFDIPVEVIENYIDDSFQLKINIEKKEIHPLKKYIAIFNRIHLKIHKRNFNFTKKEIGQLNYIMKAITETEFQKIMDYIYQKWETKEFLDWDWKRIINQLSPSLIYYYHNMLLNLIEKHQTKKDRRRW